MKPFHFNVILVSVLAFSGFVAEELGGETAKKVIGEGYLFGLQVLFGSIAATATAMLALINQTYTKHVAEQDEQKALTDGNTKTVVTEIKTNETKIDSSITPPTTP